MKKLKKPKQLWKNKYVPFNARFRLFWSRLWLRKDIWHWSYETDPYIILFMTKEAVNWYILDLTNRRNIAYEREYGFEL